MSKGKIAGGIVLGLVVIVVAGLLLVGSKLDQIVAKAIETYGSRLTGTAVTVGKVDVQLREGRITITDLRVANPEGFPAGDAFSLGRLVLALDPASLRHEPYVIDDLEIDAAAVAYDIDAKGRRNLDVIRNHMDQAEAGKPAKEGTAPPPRIIIRKLAESGGSIAVDATALGLQQRTVDLPGFTLTDLGAPDGATADVIGREVMKKLMEQAGKAALDQELKGRLDNLLGGKSLNDVTGSVESEVKDKVKGLLGGG